MYQTRREFLKTSALGAAATTLSGISRVTAVERERPAQHVLPRWRGFNLLEMFTMRSKGDWVAEDFSMMRDWGFNFVRLPMVYRLWINEGDDYNLNEAMLAKVDRAVELAGQNSLHVSLNFHRAPGYSVNREFQEPKSLWKDPEPLKAFCFHWQMMAKRYKGVGSDKLSIDLVNEPPAIGDGMTREDHERVVRTVVGAIREVDPSRLVIADGMNYGNICAPELADLKIGQSTRAYQPMFITHYKASWVNSENFPDPAWPGNGWDRARLERHWAPWIEMARGGVGVHCGEGGVYNRTPHDVTLKWFRDVLEILTQAGIGLAVWNFRGSFGILDSDRKDVEYEDFHGHKLDRKLLDLLREFE